MDGLTDPTKALYIERERIQMMNYPRSMSARRSRNPIVEGDAAPSQFPHKARVPHYLEEQKLLNDRPRGIAQSVYSSQLQGSFYVGTDPYVPYKPQKKQIGTPAQRPADSYVPTRRQVRPQTPGRNPILQDSSFDQPLWFSKKVGYQEPPSRSTGEALSPVLPGKQDAYVRRNGSNVFAQVPERDIFGTHKKAIPAKPECTGSILQYKYALPYRETNVTHKLV